MNSSSLHQLDLTRGEDSQPKYERLKSYLLGELSAGRLQPGDALPTELELAGTLGVARNTVRQALAELEHDGILLRVRGKGTFIREDVHRRLRRSVGALALVVPETRRGYYASLLHGFEKAAHEAQCQAIVCSTDNDLERQANAILQLLDKDVDGVAIVSTTNPPTPAYQIRPLQRHNIPVVLCHRTVEEIKAPVLALPFAEVGRRAGQALLEQGHRRVGFFASHPSPAAQAYEGGLREVLRAGGGELPEEFLYYGSSFDPNVTPQEPDVLAALRQICLGKNPPTAIMASFDPLAELIYLLLNGLGLRVPEDISLIGFGGTWRNGALAQRLASVVVNEEELGHRAAQLLQEMREGIRPLEDTETIYMPVGLHVGSTLGHPHRS